MAIENLKEVQSWFETQKDNEDVKTYLGSFKVEPTLEVFKNKLNDADFKSYFDSEKDKHLQKGIETFKTNNLQKLVDEEYKKKYPSKDPKEIEIENMKTEIEKMKSDGLKKELINNTLKQFQEKKLPTELVDFIVTSDAETTNKNIESLISIFAKHDEAIKTEFAKGGSYTPPNNNGNLGGDKEIREQIRKFMK